MIDSLGPSSISSCVEVRSTGTWPSAVTASTSKGNVEYTTADPMTFIKATGSSDYSSRNHYLWKSSKTICGPCPAGWRVPDGGDNGVWSKACGSSPSFNDDLDDCSDKGIHFSCTFGSASIIWYTASGCRSYYDVSLTTAFGNGFYWSVVPRRKGAYCMFFSGGNVYLLIDHDQTSGYSVRCLKVSELYRDTEGFGSSDYEWNL